MRPLLRPRSDGTKVLRRPQERFCIGCGYCLENLPEPRCPECGRDFDPSDSGTFYSGSTPRGLEKWLISPIGWPCHLAAVYLFGLGIWHAAVPGGCHGAAFLLELAFPWFLLIGYCVVRWWLRVKTLDNFFPFGTSRISRRPKRWLVAPTLLLLQLLLIQAMLPLRAGFALSRSALGQAAQSGVAVPAGSVQRAGIYRVSSVEKQPGGTLLKIQHASPGLLRDSGFYYTPGQPPPDEHTGAEGTYYRHLSGPWYAWYKVME